MKKPSRAPAAEVAISLSIAQGPPLFNNSPDTYHSQGMVLYLTTPCQARLDLTRIRTRVL